MAHTTKAATVAAAPAAQATVEEGARMVLEGLSMVRPRLDHAYGCPAQHAGPCTCGFQELLDGARELRDALQAPPPLETA